jgi:V/A-type H+-transporting ATPase subunit E
MDAKQAIIDKIISGGNALANSFIEEAQQKADKEISNARAYASDYQNKIYQIIEKEKQAIIYRKVSHAQIEAKKALLAEKQRIIEGIFKEVFEELLHNKKEYKDFLLRLIEKYSEEGDIVAVSDDGGLIDEAAVKALSQKKGIKLSRQKDEQSYNGVILKSSHYDKNLTTDQLLGQIKEKYITEITNILFDGEKV